MQRSLANGCQEIRGGKIQCKIDPLGHKNLLCPPHTYPWLHDGSQRTIVQHSKQVGRPHGVHEARRILHP